MNMKLICWIGLGVYTLLSIGDWVLTYALLHAHPHAVESNPVAAAFLEQHGWTGLALFKSAVVLVFSAAVVLILRRKPAIAATVVSLGCAALFWVTTYSHGLLIQAHRDTAVYGRVEWSVKDATRPSAGNELGVPERCWFADTRGDATRTAATTRGDTYP